MNPECAWFKQLKVSQARTGEVADASVNFNLLGLAFYLTEPGS